MNFSQATQKTHTLIRTILFSLQWSHCKTCGCHCYFWKSGFIKSQTNRTNKQTNHPSHVEQHFQPWQTPQCMCNPGNRWQFGLSLNETGMRLGPPSIEGDYYKCQSCCKKYLMQILSRKLRIFSKELRFQVCGHKLSLSESCCQLVEAELLLKFKNCGFLLGYLLIIQERAFRRGHWSWVEEGIWLTSVQGSERLRLAWWHMGR